MVAPCQRFTHQRILALKFLSVYVHRGTLPQSRIRSTAPSEREPGGVRTIHRTARKPGRCGRFSSPLRNSVFWGFNHSTKYTPSVTPFGRASSLREGAGEGLHHSTYRPETGMLRAIFIAPTKLKRFYIPPFIERHSLSHAHLGVPAPSEREPGTTKETRNQYEIS